MTELQQGLLAGAIVVGVVTLFMAIVTANLTRTSHSYLNNKIHRLDKAVTEALEIITTRQVVRESTINGHSAWISRNSNLDGLFDKLSPQMVALTVSNGICTDKLAKLVEELAEVRRLAEARPTVVSLSEEEKAAIRAQACQDALRQAALALMAESSNQPRRYVSTTEAVRMPVSVHKPTDVLLQQGDVPRTLQVGHAHCSPAEVLDLITVMSAWVCTNSIPQLKGDSYESGTEEVLSHSEA